MKLVEEYKEYILLNHGKSYRTMSAYCKYVEDFLVGLHARYGEIEIDLITNQALVVYLLGLKNKCVSTSKYIQAVSALSSMCNFLKDRYQVLGLRLPDSRILAAFPIACSEDRLLEVLYGLKQTFEDIRIKLIIRLMYMYKINLAEIGRCKKGIDGSGVVIDTKKITLNTSDQELLREYLEKLAQIMPHSSSSSLLFIPKGSSDAKPLTKQAVWSMLKRVFGSKNRQWFTP